MAAEGRPLIGLQPLRYPNNPRGPRPNLLEKWPASKFSLGKLTFGGNQRGVLGLEGEGGARRVAYNPLLKSQLPQRK